ncbi:MAG TPA: hypothetical protein PK079_01285 [Leptospiraceae bacterium]|nr:hypothetical protein [Leptospiraceae bacterium]HMW03853.1 hypothetical protein [Leptospiraceae bacterium]HMX32902.1 hypothetical protein [Leptospiraceae bacterium]HMY29833.1 hypothetical protein [Leptospiraceae bacterium]HMZ65185.1 hypothetical protein [Leptospiraceae bacterium]
MNLIWQNYFVYLIVLIAFIKLTQPIWEFLYRIAFAKKEVLVEDNSCYTGTCAKCKVRS